MEILSSHPKLDTYPQVLIGQCAPTCVPASLLSTETNRMPRPAAETLHQQALIPYTLHS